MTKQLAACAVVLNRLNSLLAGAIYSHSRLSPFGKMYFFQPEAEFQRVSRGQLTFNHRVILFAKSILSCTMPPALPVAPVGAGLTLAGNHWCPGPG